MLKTRKKWISILLTLAMLVGLMVPLAAPAMAYTDNHVSNVPSVASDAKGVALGTLTLMEDSDYLNDLQANKSFTVTFPSGVKIKNTFTATVQNAVYFTNDGSSWNEVPVANVVKSGDYTLDITIPSVTSGRDGIQLRPIVDIDGFEGGDIEVTVDGFDSGITSGKFVLGRVSAGDTSTSAIEVKTIGESGQGGTIRITENAVGAIGNDPQEITLKLPSDFKWDAANMTAARISFMAGLSGSTITKTNAYGQGAGDDFYIDGRTLKFKFDPVGTDVSPRTQRGIIQIDPWIKAEDGADYGEVEVNVSGDKIDDADVVIAKYADFGVSITADGDVKEVLSGQIDAELTKLEFKENVDNSLVPNRKTKIEFPSWIKITDVDVTDSKNISISETQFESNIKADIDGTKNDVEFFIPDASGKTEFKLTFKVSIKGNESGDIVAKVSGRGGAEGEAVIGKALTPATVDVANPTELRVGVKGQPIGDITITEAKKEAIAKGTLKVELPGDVEWSSVPKVEVTEGNIDIDVDGIDTDGSVLTIPIDNESTKPSTIKITGGKVDLDRTVPEGDVKVSIKGDAVVVNDKSQDGWLKGVDNPGSDGSATALDEGEFDQSSCASAVVAVVATPAPVDTKKAAAFIIGSDKYTVNGVEYTMDVAPYVTAAGRTYVPVRYLAYALGVNEENVYWNAETQTVTLLKGNTSVSVTIGSNVLTINGFIKVPMEVAPEIKDGRTMLPARYIAEAFGAVVGYDEATQTVTIESK